MRSSHKNKSKASLKPLPRAPALRPRVVSVNGACRYGGFGKTKCYELIDKGRIAARKFGKKTLIEVASIDRYLDSLPKLERLR